MNSAFLLMPILLALVLAAVFYLIPMRTRRARNLYLFCAALLVSLATWSLILWRPDEGFEIYRFSVVNDDCTVKVPELFRIVILI